MKRSYFFLSLFLIIAHFSLSYGQKSPDDVRLRSLEKSIDRIEDRMQKAELQMMMGDSLITHGDRQISEADQDFYRIADEVKHMNRKYRVERRKFYRLTKSADREVALKAKQAVRKLDDERRLAIRNYSTEVRDMKKKAIKGDSDIKRGQSLQSMAAKSLKSSQKELRDVQARYDMAISTLRK